MKELGNIGIGLLLCLMSVRPPYANGKRIDPIFLLDMDALKPSGLHGVASQYPLKMSISPIQKESRYLHHCMESGTRQKRGTRYFYIVSSPFLFLFMEPLYPYLRQQHTYVHVLHLNTSVRIWTDKTEMRALFAVKNLSSNLKLL